MANRWSLGLDIGASATKAVLLDDDAPHARALRRSGANFDAAAKACLDDIITAAWHNERVAWIRNRGNCAAWAWTCRRLRRWRFRACRSC